MTLCGYKKFGYIGGHWCNECPPSGQYFQIEKREAAELAALNKKLKEKTGRSKRGRN